MRGAMSKILLALLIGTLAVSLGEAQVKTKNVEGFGGVIAEKYEDSKEWWPPETRPPEGAPNVLILLLDDVGFAQLSQSFGGLIETPTSTVSPRADCATTTSTPRRCAHRPGPR